MDQAANASTPQATINQPAGTNPPALGITALAARHAHLFEVIDDNERDDDEVRAVETMMLCGEPVSLDDVLSLVCMLEVEFEAIVSNISDDDDNAPVFRRLLKAVQAIKRGLMRNGATSPMAPECQR